MFLVLNTEFYEIMAMLFIPSWYLYFVYLVLFNWIEKHWIKVMNGHSCFFLELQKNSFKYALLNMVFAEFFYLLHLEATYVTWYVFKLWAYVELY